jgi:FMN-dependent NADH-azoreductase
MTTILHLRCSPRGAEAFSSKMAQEVLTRLLHHYQDAEVVFRDLSAVPPPLVDADFSAAILGLPGIVPPALETSEVLIRELEAADVLVIATPMHNYCVPAVLKAWVDQIVRIHRTFASTPGGKVGKLRDRPVWLVVASGGWFTGPSPSGAPAQPDFLTPYMRAILATIGISDVHVLTLEGVTRGADIAEAAIARARAVLDRELSPRPAPEMLDRAALA